MGVVSAEAKYSLLRSRIQGAVCGDDYTDVIIGAGVFEKDFASGQSRRMR